MSDEDDRPQRPVDHMQEMAPGMLMLGRLIGLFNPEVREQTKHLKTELEKFEGFREAERDFRRRFVPRGWASYDNLSADLTRDIVDMDEADAEQRLTAHFIDPDLLMFLGYRFHRADFKAWAPHYERAREHLTRGDTISAVPLLLLITDGIAQRWLNMSPYSGATEGEVFDTFTSEDGGLADTFKVHGARRAKKMQTDPIDTPFRNGILHGNDVAYGEEIVAAKAVNALAATLDYVGAVRSEAERLEKAAAEQATPRLRDLADTLRSTQALKDAAAAWEARPAVTDTAIYDASDDPETFDTSTPEGGAALYLHDLQNRRYGKLAPRTVNFADYSMGKIAGKMAKDMKDIGLETWTVTGVEDTAAAAAWVTAEIEGTFDDHTKTDSFRLRMVFQGEDNKPLVRGMPDGRWMVMPDFVTNLWRLSLP